MVPRDYCWASELGGAYIDRWLKMKGTPRTNPPNSRSLRKFACGSLIEWVVEMVLRQAGILIDAQEHLTYQYDGLLPVTGKLDFLAGGVPDWDKALAEMSLFPPTMRYMSAGVVENLKATFGDDELRQVVIEVKSVGSQLFGSRYDKPNAKPNPLHQNQIFHYLKSKDMELGLLCYISKDDLKMVEFGIMNPGPAEAAYKHDISMMTGYWSASQRPDPEPFVIFDDVKRRFSLNWKITYSDYLTMLYGYEKPMDYAENSEWATKVKQWNQTFTRCIAGANMTKLNQERIADCKRFYPSFDTLVDQARAAAATDPSILQEDPE